ncbi:MAG: hypothetical protein U9Q90_01620 [Campylobacterota bacterium]|nr:hypothetical protein [Campylobacterota bacterium]
MKKIVILLLITTGLLAENNTTHEGFARVHAKYKSDACDIAKKKARETFEIIEMNPGCRCERTDGYEWMCDAVFTYTKEK